VRRSPVVLLAWLVGVDAAAAPPVYLDVRGVSSLTAEELRDAVAARVELAREARPDALLVTVVLEPEHVVLVADGRVVRVGLGGRESRAAARGVAIAVSDLVARLPAVPAPPERRAALAAWPAFVLGPGNRTRDAIGVAVDASLPLGPARAALTVQLDRSFALDRDGRSFARVTALGRPSLGVRLGGGIELRAGPLVAVTHVEGGNGHTALLLGGSLGAQIAAQLGADLALLFTAGVDGYTRRLRYTVLGELVLETPRAYPWVGVGLVWGWGS
jgi:hypothetical protein